MAASRPLAWRLPWTEEEPGGPWPMGCRESGTAEVTEHARRRLAETKPLLPASRRSASVSITVWATPDYSLAASTETSPSNTRSPPPLPPGLYWQQSVCVYSSQAVPGRELLSKAGFQVLSDAWCFSEILIFPVPLVVFLYNGIIYFH